ncbi:replicative helicase loader/inhibitor [Bacillus sp. JJ1503]|uniref:replicative helicase loader/inhibitor n=1 Tax=Bacillus sp. JJ1503 TaxID=3122956 RepID=UPI002FFFFA6A
MTKRETFHLMTLISMYYEQFELNQEKVNLWNQVLKGFSVDQLHRNLLDFVAESPYPPKISDLIRKPAAVSRVVPSCDDTMHILHIDYRPASREVVERELARMRKILGIRRGEG